MQHGCHVIMACRNNARCEQARADLVQRGLPGTAECMQVHLDDMASVRTFAAQVVHKLQHAKRRLRVLVNNAGMLLLYLYPHTQMRLQPFVLCIMQHPPSTHTHTPGVMAVPPDPRDGLDGHLRPNHFGPFLLTCCLGNSLDPRGSRIVNVGSRAHFQGTLVIDPTTHAIQGTPRHWYTQYARSKLCNVLWTLELQRRLLKAGPPGEHITAYCISPGRVATNIFNNIPGCLRPLVQGLARVCFKTPAQGATTVVHAATAPELHGRHVLHLKNCQEAPVSAAGRDVVLAKRLWDVSERFVGLRGEERAGLLFVGE